MPGPLPSALRLSVWSAIRHVRVEIARRIDPGPAATHERGRVLGWNAGYREAVREQLRLVAEHEEHAAIG